MKKKQLMSNEKSPNKGETVEQYARRIRSEAVEKLSIGKQAFNKEAVRAGMSLSEESSFFGDLSKKFNPDS